MAKPNPTVLLTRSGAASRRFADQIAARFGDVGVVISPAIQIVFRDAVLPLEGVRDIVFTSQNAVQGVCRLTDRRDLRAWCVGGRTAQVARDAGFEVREGPGDAQGLLRLILADRPLGRVIWARGEHAAVDVAEVLNSAGIETVSAILYTAEPLPPGPEAAALLAGDAPVIVPLFSARTAQIVASWTRGAHAPLTVLALSDAVAAAQPPCAATIVAPQPDSAGMLDALAAALDPPAEA